MWLAEEMKLRPRHHDKHQHHHGRREEGNEDNEDCENDDEDDRVAILKSELYTNALKQSHQ